jgi:hypothetical protein
MLDCYDITEALAATLALIPDLAAAMTVTENGNTVVRISAFHYLLGQERQYLRAIYEMPAPSMLVVWRGDVGGEQMTQVRHKYEIHCRMGNAAGQEDPVGYEQLWNLFCNAAPTGFPRNIRYINILPGLEIMENLPTCELPQDRDEIDRFVITLVIPEIGDE